MNKKQRHDSDDSSDEDDHKKVEIYNELDELTKFIKLNPLANNQLQKLSFISHALGIELLYFKKTQQAYLAQKQKSLIYTRYTFNDIDIANFSYKEQKSVKEDDGLSGITEGLAKNLKINISSTNQEHIEFLAATRFMNRNAKRIAKDIRDNKSLDFKISQEKVTPQKGSHPYYKYTYKQGMIFGDGSSIRSEHIATTKKATRGHKVEVGIGYETYSEYADFLSINPQEYAIIIREISKNIYSTKFTSQSKYIQNKLLAITKLLFSCEASKNPAVYIHNHMLLDFIDIGLSWKDALLKFMPMSPTGSIMNARAINKLYKKYMPIDYTYDYVNSTADQYSQKNLVDREGLLVKLWLKNIKSLDLDKVKTTDVYKKVIETIKESIQDWYGISLDNSWYSEDQIRILLEHYLSNDEQFYIAPQTQFEHSDLLRANVEFAINQAIDGIVAVLPINLHNNHWVGIVISNNQDGSLVVVYVDPMGNQLASEPNSELLISAIQELSPGANIIDLSSVNFRQQNNDYDCGPFTADNLVRLARYFSEYYGDNITAEKIKSEILDIPDSLSAESQRIEHSHIFNGDVESPVVEKDKNESEVEEEEEEEEEKSSESQSSEETQDSALEWLEENELEEEYNLFLKRIEGNVAAANEVADYNSPIHAFRACNEDDIEEDSILRLVYNGRYETSENGEEEEEYYYEEEDDDDQQDYEEQSYESEPSVNPTSSPSSAPSFSPLAIIYDPEVDSISATIYGEEPIIESNILGAMLSTIFGLSS